MTAEQYRRWSAPFRDPGRARALRAVNRGLMVLCLAAYPLCLLWLLARHHPLLLSAVLVPGTGFGFVSVFRRLYNAPRPYEALDIVPLKEKDRQGQSFPSRHVFSVFVIGMTLLRLCVPLGAALLALGAVMAWCRVILGVHYPRDVIAGAALGVLWGGVGLWGMFG